MRLTQQEFIEISNRCIFKDSPINKTILKQYGLDNKKIYAYPYLATTLNDLMSTKSTYPTLTEKVVKTKEYKELKEIIYLDSFQKAIINLRDYCSNFNGLEIPPPGFKNIENREKWENTFYNLHPRSLKKDRKHIELNKNPYILINKEIKKIENHFRLKRYESLIFNYLLENKLLTKGYSFNNEGSVFLQFEENDMHLNVTRSNSQKDIDDLINNNYNLIKRMQKSYDPNFFNRDDHLLVFEDKKILINITSFKNEKDIHNFIKNNYQKIKERQAFYKHVPKKYKPDDLQTEKIKTFIYKEREEKGESTNEISQAIKKEFGKTVSNSLIDKYYSEEKKRRKQDYLEK